VYPFDSLLACCHHHANFSSTVLVDIAAFPIVGFYLGSDFQTDFGSVVISL
jgi:hypothetical protein